MNQSYGELSKPDTLVLERNLPGPIERLWQYLTEPELRGKWLAAGPLELQTGGGVELRFNNNALTTADDPPPAKYASHAEHTIRGTVTACEPPYLLSYTWPMGAGEASEVRFELSEQGEQVRLKLTHTRLATNGQKLSVASGWHVHLDILLAVLQNQTPPPLWASFTKFEAEYAQRFG